MPPLWPTAGQGGGGGAGLVGQNKMLDIFKKNIK